MKWEKNRKVTDDGHASSRDDLVCLSGEVERSSEKELVERWVALIDGVVGVESSLTFAFDEGAMRHGYGG